MNISEQEFDAILKLSPEKRYSYFVKKVCDWEQIYTLGNDASVVMNEDKNGVKSIFLFPFEVFASHYAQNESDIKKSSCRSFKVDNFINGVIEKLISNDVVNALVFPVPDGYGFVVSFNQLKSDIEKELENY